MTLSTSRVGAVVPVSDIGRAREFYERKLGLTAGSDDPDGGRTYPCREGSSLHIMSAPTNAGKSTSTLAGWTVDDLERTVEELIANGVTFGTTRHPSLPTTKALPW
jgi:catechol 2,3-dioxygenase-like lactoylglutathione lyase family enzyme